LELDVDKLRPPIMRFSGKAFVEDKKVADAFLTATIVER
jgi:hypothetical protein